MRRAVLRALKTVRALLLAAAVCVILPAAPAQEDRTAQAPPATVVPADRLKEQWWKDRHEAKKARVAEGNVDLLLLGDSIMNRWDTTAVSVAEYYYGDRNCVDLGFGSDRTQHLLWRLNDLPMEKIHPKAAVILIGVNNISRDRPEDIALGVKACVDKAAALYPDMKILLLDIFPVRDHADPARENIAAVNARLAEMFNDYPNLTLMDLSSLWLDENGDVPKDLMDDGVHPTVFGYKLWAARIEPVIAEMLGDEPKPKME